MMNWLARVQRIPFNGMASRVVNMPSLFIYYLVEKEVVLFVVAKEVRLELVTDVRRKSKQTSLPQHETPAP